MDFINIAQAAEVVAGEAVKNKSFVESLGLNLYTFIAQLINFSLVLLVLWRWVYRPLSKALNDRAKRVEDSLDKAKKIEEEFKKLEQLKLDQLQAIKKDADNLIREAALSAEKNKEEILISASEEAKQVLAEAREKISEEKAKIKGEVQQEIGELVVLVAEKIFKKNTPSGLDEDSIRESLKSLDKK
jgi:F-type H+-transporting ATPase subunit b